MQLDRVWLRQEIHKLYAREHQELGEKGTNQLLEEARQWDLSPTLNSGGVVVFPHAGVNECGHQIAAAVNACLDSDADRVLVISALHAFTDEMEDARIRVAKGGDMKMEKYWGIQGPGLDGSQDWEFDHALMSFRHFWQAEIKRRGVKGPEVIEKYPYLAAGKPEILPGIDELEKIAKDSVIVSTADPFHHGIGYGDAPEDSLHPQDGGIKLARRVIQEGIEILERGDYWGYNQHCVDAKSDARDAGQVFRYLRGPMKGQILDISYTDAGELYQHPPPTWVAGVLFEWKLRNTL